MYKPLVDRFVTLGSDGEVPDTLGSVARCVLGLTTVFDSVLLMLFVFVSAVGVIHVCLTPLEMMHGGNCWLLPSGAALCLVFVRWMCIQCGVDVAVDSCSRCCSRWC